MKRYDVVFENIEKFCFLYDVKREYTLLVSKEDERKFLIYDTESKNFLYVIADNEEKAIRHFISWSEGTPMVYKEEEYDYVPFDNISSHYSLYTEPIHCDWIIEGK